MHHGNVGVGNLGENPRTRHAEEKGRGCIASDGEAIEVELDTLEPAIVLLELGSHRPDVAPPGESSQRGHTTREQEGRLTATRYIEGSTELDERLAQAEAEHQPFLGVVHARIFDRSFNISDAAARVRAVARPRSLTQAAGQDARVYRSSARIKGLEVIRHSAIKIANDLGTVDPAQVVEVTTAVNNAVRSTTMQRLELKERQLDKLLKKFRNNLKNYPKLHS